MGAYVTFQTRDNGDVVIIATGSNGTLSLIISGGKEGPAMALVDHPDPGELYRGKWELRANGRLKGWLVDTEGKYQWIPERATRKRSAKKKQAAKSVRKEG
jgi:hypothetical protein